MERKEKDRHGYYRKRLKWMIRNNLVYCIIVGTICIAIGYLLAIKAYNHRRVKNMETILGKDLRTIHRITGLTDHDVEKLRKEYPNFNWEGTWDRQRWKAGNEKSNMNSTK